MPTPLRHFLLATLLAMPAILLHELGHVAVAQLAGFTPVLHHASVDGIPEAAPWGGNPMGTAAAALAGPLVTGLLLLLALWGARRNRAWGLPLLAAAPMRFVINLLFLLQSLLVSLGIFAAAGANFDELTAARALGLPEVPVVAAGALVLVVAWGALLKARPGWRNLLALFAGALLGTMLWLGRIGPALIG